MRLSLRRLALSRIRSRQRAKGQALVEFAVVAPVLFLVIAGMLDPECQDITPMRTSKTATCRVPQFAHVRREIGCGSS